MKKKVSAVFLSAMVLVSCFYTPAYAAGEGTAGDSMSSVGRKFGRGLGNVLSSPAEIPCTMTSEIKDRGAAAGTFTGLGLGLTYMVRRILVGVTEVGTFMIPMEATIPRVCSSEPLPAAQ